MQRLRLREEGGGAAKPTRFIGAYVEVLADHLLGGASDGENAVATAATTARHRKTEREEIIIKV